MLFCRGEGSLAYGIDGESGPANHSSHATSIHRRRGWRPGPQELRRGGRQHNREAGLFSAVESTQGATATAYRRALRVRRRLLPGGPTWIGNGLAGTVG
ncbi:hypothetical protein GCM10017559_64490 [Streptosporangium longisporum]|uniref:Uncharacterized protein n=1 Tax=Streptosporangium longisporum TaxID=46187 RepID=A0ABP6L345_9ACTN